MQLEKLKNCTYPLSIKKDGIGGGLADAFNAGYEGKEGGVYRFVRYSAGDIFYRAGKARKKLDTNNPH